VASISLTVLNHRLDTLLTRHIDDDDDDGHREHNSYSIMTPVAVLIIIS